MRITNHANLSDEALVALEAVVPAHTTLMEVVTWGRQLHPSVFLQETIALDEYTHEVLLRWREGLWLVYSAS
ncbi:MAG: hypothetical protein HOP19_20040 [Acidobacteria bacterium]|nr:hypothetical protein [Acidobacteriota bacterium]